LSVIRRPLPISDECTTATLLELGQGTYGPVITSSNIGVTDSGIQHSCGTYSGGDVWFAFVAPPSGQVTIEVSNDGDDVVDNASLFEGNCSSPIQCLAVSNTTNDVRFSGLTQGATYRFAVYESGNSSFGSFDICAYATEPSSNDDCTSATVLTVAPEVCGSSVTATNLGATDSGVNHNLSSCHDDYLGGDIWFSFAAPVSGEVTLVVSNDPDDIADDYVLYEACTTNIVDCGALSTSTSEVFTGLTPGTTYTIAIWEDGNNNFGSFDIYAFDPNPALPGEACQVPIPIACGQSYSGDNTNISASDSPNWSINGNPIFSSKKVWYSFTGDGSAIDFDFGQPFGFVAMIYSSDCNSLSCEQGESNPVFSFQTTSGVDYLLAYSGLNETFFGPFTFNVICASTNNCPDDYAGGGSSGSLAPLAGAQNVTEAYKTSGSIISDQVIGGTNIAIAVTYSAGTSASSITLQSDFEVKLGVVFDAVMDGCN